MLIKNLTLSVISLPGAPGEPHGRLIPGVNEVTVEAWELALPHMALALEADQIEVVEVNPSELELADGEPAPTGTVKPSTIAELSNKAAIKLIKSTFDRDLLATWFVDEKRAKIVAALEAQEKLVTAGGTKAEGLLDEGDDSDELEG